MKLILRLIFIIFLVTVILGLSTAYYFHRYGQGVFQEAFSSGLGQDVSFKKIHYRFPFTVKIKDVKVGDLLTTKKVSAQLGFESILQKEIVLANVVVEEPIITLSKSSVSISTGETPQPQVKKKNTTPSKFKILIKQLKLEDADITFNYIAPKPLTIHLKNVDLKLNQIVLPASQSLRTRFILTAFLDTAYPVLSQKKLIASGWFDLAQNDMDAQAHLLDQQGNRSLETTFLSKANDLAVSGYINHEISLKDLGIQLPTQIPTDGNAQNNLIAPDLKIGTFFKFKTKMDNFEVSKISFSGSVATDEKAGMVSQPKN